LDFSFFGLLVLGFLLSLLYLSLHIIHVGHERGIRIRLDVAHIMQLAGYCAYPDDLTFYFLSDIIF